MKSSILIDKGIGQKLIELIKPLQDTLYNYRDEKCITDDLISNTTFSMNNKPKLQEIISQFQYFREYKQLKQSTFDLPKEMGNYLDDTIYIDAVSDRHLPINLCPAIFSLQRKRFLTEINALVYRDNSKLLYQLIGEAFYEFIPIFEWLLDIKLLSNDEYKQPTVIVKIQDLQIKGDQHDNIIAVGLYYFDMTDIWLKSKKN